MEMNVHVNGDSQFTNYSFHSVTIKGKEYSQNIVVTNKEIRPFLVEDIEQIALSDLDAILTNNPDLIIFGYGDKVKYPGHELHGLLKKLHQKAIGVEVMPIPALCRTFNFLSSENRNVVAVLLFGR